MSVSTIVVFADLMGSTGVFETIGSARGSRVVTQTVGRLLVHDDSGVQPDAAGDVTHLRYE